jgi:hypothetical protein
VIGRLGGDLLKKAKDKTMIRKTVLFIEYNSNEAIVINCVGFDVNGDIITFRFSNGTKSNAYVVNRNHPIQVI